MKAIAAVIAIAAPLACDAACWVATNFNGMTVRKYNAYKANQDGLSSEKGKPLVVVLKIGQKKAEVTGWNDGGCAAISDTEVQCRGANNMEIWRVDTEARKAFYVQYRRGAGVMDGGGVFVGDIIGNCEQK